MTRRIVPLTEAHCTGVVALLNETLADVPHAYAVTEDELVRGLTVPNRWLTRRRAFVAEEAGRVTAFGGAGFYHRARPKDLPRMEPGTGVIECLFCRPDDEAAGVALLEAMERHLRRARPLIAWDYNFGYPFYRINFSLVSERLGRIRSVFEQRGFRWYRSELALDQAPLRPVPVTSAPKGLTIVLETPPVSWAKPEIRVTAHHNGRRVGHCFSVPVSKYHSTPEAQRWIYTDALGVNPNFQRQGLARHLMTQALHAARKLGYENATLCTGHDNYRAQGLYFSLGYTLVDRLDSFIRD